MAASIWPYCVSGGELAKANGKGPAHVKLRARTSNTSYGQGGFSFVHVTQDGRQCLNRVDMVYCRCGQVHGHGGSMFSQLKGATSTHWRGGSRASMDGRDRAEEAAPSTWSI